MTETAEHDKTAEETTPGAETVQGTSTWPDAKTARKRRRMALPAGIAVAVAGAAVAAVSLAYPAAAFEPTDTALSDGLVTQVEDSFGTVMRHVSIKLPAKHIVMLTDASSKQALTASDGSSSDGASSSKSSAVPASVANLAVQGVVAENTHAIGQQWMVMERDDGSSSLMSVASNKLLIVDDESRWMMFPAGDNSFSILAANDPAKAIAFDNGKATLQASDDKGSFSSVTMFDVTAMEERLSALAKENASTVQSGTYFIVPAGQEEEPSEFLSTTEEGLLSLGDKSRGNARKWEVKVDANGFVTLAHPADSTALGIDAEIPIRNTAAALQSPGTSSTQQWIAVPDGNGGFLLESAAWEGLFLDYTQGETGDAVATVMPRDLQRGQSWALVKGVINAEAAKRFADIALAEVQAGKDDGTRNRGGDKYWTRFADTYDAWCSEFTAWCMTEAGLETGKNMPSEPTYSEAFLNYYENHPEYGTVHHNNGSYRPQVGDIELDGSDLHHTCLVTEVYDDCYYVAEGNIGDVTLHSERDYDGTAEYFITINWEAALAD